MPSSTLIIMDVYLLYLSRWQEPEDMRESEGNTMKLYANLTRYFIHVLIQEFTQKKHLEGLNLNK